VKQDNCETSAPRPVSVHDEQPFVQEEVLESCRSDQMIKDELTPTVKMECLGKPNDLKLRVSCVYCCRRFIVVDYNYTFCYCTQSG